MDVRKGETGDAGGTGSPGVEASSLADKARAHVTEAAEPLKQEALATAERQKDYGADQIGGLAQAVHGVASELERQMPQAAGYVHSAASNLDRMASSLRDQSVDDLMQSFGKFARAQPAAVFGAAVLAGIALSRYVKSSGHGAPDANRGGTHGIRDQ
ncbi:MAG: hypothetical protein BroJett029_18550 [Alphaproteobacteria bacterium]|nr:MAG: hypothetical protein BroJett029_18550 [Alphaproteobacteria bacterium]